jgi:hypothetical protein
VTLQNIGSLVLPVNGHGQLGMGANLCVFLQFVKLISRILESCRSMELLEVGMGRSSFSMMAAINFWVAILLGCFLFSCPEDGGFWRGE